MKLSLTHVLSFVLFFLISGAVAGQACACEITQERGLTVFSEGCNYPAEICAIKIGDNVPQVDLERFADLRGVHVKLGRDASASFLGSALSNRWTKFNAKDGASVVLKDVVGGVDRTLQDKSTITVNTFGAYNKELQQCSGDCSLLQPSVLAESSAVGVSSFAAAPVTLLSWEATAAPEGVRLKWESAEEVDNDYFTVLHSKNGIDFEEIARVTGSGFSNRIIPYQIVDAAATPGINYYRLEQVDYDGTRSILGLRQATVVHALATTVAGISPNPAAPGSSVRVSIDDPAGTPVRIADFAGRPVAETRLDARGSFELPGDLAPGLYVFIVREQALRVVVRP